MSPLRRLWNVLRRSRLDDDLRQELDTHVALIEEEGRRQGLTAEQARQNATARFGNPLAYRERVLDEVIATWFEDACTDVLFLVRVLVRAPGLWSQKFATEMERVFKAGALGMKVFTSLGEEVKNPDGSFIQVDDPRLDPIWAMAAKYDKPIMIHTSDSIAPATHLGISTAKARLTK